MNNFVLPQASLFLGIVPALLLLYISLKGYEGLYKEKNIFLSFIVGVIAGVLAVVIELATSSIGAIFIILFPLMEQLLKTVILNMRRLQQKKETVIYGLCLGLGFGSIFTPFSLITSNITTADTLMIALIVIESWGIILLHAATGACIGYGVYERKLAKYVVLATLMYIPVTTITLVTTYYHAEYIRLAIVLYGIAIYWYVLRNIIPRILPQSGRRRRLKRLQQK